MFSGKLNTKMDWLNSLQNGKIKQLVSTVQTGAQLVSTVNQIRQSFSGEETTIQRTQNELTFTAPSNSNDGGTKTQNLHGDFSKEFLKEIAKKSPTLLEEPNPTNGCTPLLNAVKNNNFDAAIQLLAHGANVHAADLDGNTSLHHAIMSRSTQMVKLLLLFRANFKAENAKGFAAISLKTSSEVAELLSHIRAHAEHGILDGNGNGKEKQEGVAKLLQSRCDQIRQDQTVQYQLGKTPEQKANSIRMLSLDGGGIRGLVLIQMLMELEELRSDADCQPGKKPAGRKTFVQRNFDWIAGTSTGAILALALADGTPLINCLRLYLRLKDEIFCAAIRPYPSECIEGFLKEQFGENRKMNDLKSGKTRVFVTATKADQIPIKLVLFRNYRSPFNQHPEFEPERMQIWKAARCSSAAPTYFSSVNGIMDGGLMVNNPGATLLLELARQIDAIKANLLNADRCPDLAYLLSLGTGKTPEIPISVSDVDLGKGFSMQSIIQTANALSNLKSILVEQLATSDGQVVETSREIAHSRHTPYFRLTPSLKTDIQLDTVDNNQLIDMMWTTKIYMREKCSTDLLNLLTLMRQFEREE